LFFERIAISPDFRNSDNKEILNQDCARITGSMKKLPYPAAHQIRKESHGWPHAV